MSFRPKEGELVEVISGDEYGQHAWYVGPGENGQSLVGLRAHPQRGVLSVAKIAELRFCPHDDCRTQLTRVAGRGIGIAWWCWRCERRWKAGEHQRTKICSRCKIPKLKTGECYTCPQCGN